MPFIRQFSNVDIGYFNNRFSFLSKWKQSLISLEIFSKMMNKFEVWEEDKKGRVSYLLNFLVIIWVSDP